jgi:hypothetical protein
MLRWCERRLLYTMKSSSRAPNPPDSLPNGRVLRFDAEQCRMLTRLLHDPYRRIPERLRWAMRPLNLANELASFLPGRARARVTTATDCARHLLGLRRARYRLRRLEGLTPDGEHLVCLLATNEHSARYWTGRLFASAPVERILGELPARAILRACAERAREADVSLWQVPWPLSRLAGTGPRIPSWVQLELELARGASLDGLITGTRSGRKARRNDARRVRGLGLTPRITIDPAEWETFRRDLYEPFARSRFGDVAVTLGAEEFRHIRRSGELLLLERDGRTLAGTLIEAWRDHAQLRVCGVRTCGPDAPEVLLQACYYHALAHVVERGVTRLSLGACRPVLTDGVLRYKRKWGARLAKVDTRDAFILRYHHTSAARSALTACPLIAEYPSGRLVALVGAAGVVPDTLAAHVDGLAVPGLTAIGCLTDEAIGPCVVPALVQFVPPGTIWPAGAAPGH